MTIKNIIDVQVYHWFHLWQVVSSSDNFYYHLPISSKSPTLAFVDGLLLGSFRSNNISAILGHLWSLGISLFRILCITTPSCLKVKHIFITSSKGLSFDCSSRLGWKLHPSSHLSHLHELCPINCSLHLRIKKNRRHFR